ncbi:MAG: NADH-quinone oxidoreductase subunit N [Armatimonadota bacterium]
MPVQNLTLFIPELLLCALAIGVLMLDLFLSCDQKRWLPIVTVAGLVLFAVASVQQWDPTRAPVLEFWGSYSIDSFAVFFKVLFAVVGILIVLLSTDFFRKIYAYGEYFSLLLFALVGMSLLAGAVDLVTIYLAFELVSLVSYVLAGYLRRDKKSNEASLKYFLYGAAASAVMIYGMSLLYGLGGSTNLHTLANRLAANSTAATFSFLPEGLQIGPLNALALILILAGLGYKVAIAPFQAWSPDVYEGAPTPVTAFLSVGPKAAGFAILARFLLIVGPSLVPQWQMILAILATLTMFVGNLLAIRQTSLKRMLAYSSIAHAGYLLIGVVAAGSQSGWGVPAVMYYLVAYLFMNLGVFGYALLLEKNTGTDDIGGFRGLAKGSLADAFTMVVLLMALTGLPPTAGFVGKFYLFGAAVRTGTWWWLGLMGVINSAISLYYYMNIARLMFFNQERAELPQRPSGVVVVIWLCLIVTLGMCFLPGPLLSLAQQAGAFPGGY